MPSVGAQWPHSTRARRQHRQPAVLQGTVPAAPGEAQRAQADADPGSAAVPNPETLPAPCIAPPARGRASLLTSALTATATASCVVGSAASPRGDDGHGGVPDSRHARLPGRGAPVDAGGGRVPGGIPRGAAGTGPRIRPHTRAALLRLWRCAGVRVPGVPPVCSCSPG